MPAAAAAHRIRPASVQDAARIEWIARRTWAQTYAGLIPDEAQEAFLAQAYALPALETAIREANGSHCFLVAEREAQVVAFAEFVPDSTNRSVELRRIYALPEAQGLGLGSALLEHGLARLRSEGLEGEPLWLRVEAGNQPALDFYARKGFICRPAKSLEAAGACLCGMRCERQI